MALVSNHNIPFRLLQLSFRIGPESKPMKRRDNPRIVLRPTETRGWVPMLIQRTVSEHSQTVHPHVPELINDVCHQTARRHVKYPQPRVGGSQSRQKQPHFHRLPKSDLVRDQHFPRRVGTAQVLN